MLANVAAHELGNVLGLNHQPTDDVHYWLWADDPDNNPGTADDSNHGAGLMSYAPISVDLSRLLELGTNIITPNEFPTGDIDTVDLLLRWLA